MDSPDSTGAGLLHSLNAVVTFLHSEGFYAAGARFSGRPVTPLQALQPSVAAWRCRPATGELAPVPLPPLPLLPTPVFPAQGRVHAGSYPPVPMRLPYLRLESLLREIENRYPAPDAISPRHISASPGSSGGDGGSGFGAATAGADVPQRRRSSGSVQQADTVDFLPALAAAQSLTPVDSMESAEK